MKKIATITCALAALVAAGCGSSSSPTPKTTSKTASATVCPHSPVIFAVEPYDTGPALEKAYASLATDLSKGLGCPVKLTISNSYVAEIDAMRGGNIDIGEFGPLGYVLAHKIANAQPVAAFGDVNGKPDTYTAGIWVPKGSAVKSLGQLKGKTIALSSTTSTSGGLYPISALINAGFKCTATSCQGITLKFAGSHTASLLALTHGSVAAGEVNSQQQASATKAGQFKAADYRQIWKSTAIINDPVTVWGNLPAAFKAKVATVLLGLTPAQTSVVDTELGTATNGPMVAASDALYNQVRAVANAVHLTPANL